MTTRQSTAPDVQERADLQRLADLHGQTMYGHRSPFGSWVIGNTTEGIEAGADVFTADPTPSVSATLAYNGRQVATATAVERVGVNLRVTYSTGYQVVAPPSACDAAILAMVRP